MHDADLAARREQIEVLLMLSDFERTCSKWFQDMEESSKWEKGLNGARISNTRPCSAAKVRLHQSAQVAYIKDGVIRWADEKLNPLLSGASGSRVIIKERVSILLPTLLNYSHLSSA